MRAMFCRIRRNPPSCRARRQAWAVDEPEYLALLDYRGVRAEKQVPRPFRCHGVGRGACGAARRRERRTCRCPPRAGDGRRIAPSSPRAAAGGRERCGALRAGARAVWPERAAPHLLPDAVGPPGANVNATLRPTTDAVRAGHVEHCMRPVIVTEVQVGAGGKHFVVRMEAARPQPPSQGQSLIRSAREARGDLPEFKRLPAGGHPDRGIQVCSSQPCRHPDAATRCSRWLTNRRQLAWTTKRAEAAAVTLFDGGPPENPYSRNGRQYRDIALKMRDRCTHAT